MKTVLETIIARYQRRLDGGPRIGEHHRIKPEDLEKTLTEELGGNIELVQLILKRLTTQELPPNG